MSEAYVPSGQQGNQLIGAKVDREREEKLGEEALGKSSRIQAIHLLILGGLSALGPLSMDMYLPALPAMTDDLGASMSQAQLTLSAGILGLAIGQVIVGPASDALGRKRPLIAGMVIFAISSLLTLVVPTVGWLILLRFVQGLSGAAGIALALAVVNDLYADTTQARFFSLLMQVSGLAPIIAPIIGSQLLIFTSWRGVFVALAVVGVVLLTAVAFGLEETLPVARRQSGGLSSTARALRDLMTDRYFVAYALACGFAFAAGITYISSAPFILQNLFGLSAQTMGIVFAVNALGIVIAAQVNARLVGKVSSQTLLTWGGALLALSGVALLTAVLSGIGLAGMLPSLFLMVASFGMIVPNATTLALAGTETAGSASGLLGVLQLLIGALIAPLVGAFGTTSALPMAVAIAAFGVAGLATVTLFRRPVEM